MLFTIGFVFWRFAEILTLIPIVGMLAYFVNGYVSANVLTPDYILVLFIVSVIALAWAIFTLFLYHRSSNNARFVALVDLGFVGALIAGVYYLRFIAGADCTNIRRGDGYDVSFGIFGTFYGSGVAVDTDKTCALLKASFALGIMNTVFFFFTAVLAWIHGRHLSRDTRRRSSSGSKRYYRETHYSRRGHRTSRSHSRSRRHSQGGASHRSRSRRSSHSHRQVYV